RPTVPDDLRDLGTMGLSLYRVRAILSNHNMCLYHNTYLVRKGASMPTQSLPAPSLRTAICLPAGRMLTRASNPLIYRILCAIWRAISVAGSIFLPALREARGSGVGLAGRRRAGAAVPADPQQPHRPHR